MAYDESLAKCSGASRNGSCSRRLAFMVRGYVFIAFSHDA